MTYSSYRDMPQNLERLIEFTGNSVSTRWNDGAYEVWSYSTIILSHDPLNGDIFNNEYFSPTTSKLQNILIDVFKLNGGKRKRSN